MLTEERDPNRLAEQEADESTAKYLSYYDRDLVVVDWDAALVIDEPRYFDETLYVMELANVQLAELEAYDRMLDAAVERSYRDVTQRRFRLGHDAQIQGELREIRIDLARLSDELSNITKFFGDWHSARIYQALSADSISPTGTMPSTKSSKLSTTCTSFSAPSATPLDVHPGSNGLAALCDRPRDACTGQA